MHAKKKKRSGSFSLTWYNLIYGVRFYMSDEPDARFNFVWKKSMVGQWWPIAMAKLVPGWRTWRLFLTWHHDRLNSGCATKKSRVSWESFINWPTLWDFFYYLNNCIASKSHKQAAATYKQLVWNFFIGGIFFFKYMIVNTKKIFIYSLLQEPMSTTATPSSVRRFAHPTLTEDAYTSSQQPANTPSKSHGPNPLTLSSSSIPLAEQGMMPVLQFVCSLSCLISCWLAP